MIFNPKNILLSLGLFAVGASSIVQAQTIILNFGSGTSGSEPSTSVVSTGNAGGAGSLPYDPAASGSTEYMNAIKSGSTAYTSLVYSDNTSVSGATVYLGRSDTTVANLKFFTSSNPSVTGYTGGNETGVLVGTRTAGEDGILYGTSGVTENYYVGAAVGGLAAGEYRITLVGNKGTSGSMQFWATATNDLSTISSAGSYTTNTSTASNSSFTNWSEGTNYVTLDVTLTAGQYLVFYSSGASSTEYRGFMNLAEITAVPEPSDLVMSCFGVLGVLLIGRLKRVRV